MPKRKLSELTENCYIVCDSNEQLRVIVGMLEKEGYVNSAWVGYADTVIWVSTDNAFVACKPPIKMGCPHHPASDFLPDGEEKHPDLTNITSVMAEYIRAGKSFSYDAGTGTLTLKTEQ